MGNVKKIVAPIVGMTFFWAYFRYQAVFGTLYPLGSEVSVFGYGIQLYTVFLIEALVLSVMLFVGKKGRIGFVDHRNHGRSFEHVRSSGSFRCGRFLAFNFVNRYRVFGKLSCLGAVLLEFVWGKASSLAGDIVFHEHRSPYGPFSFVCFDEASSYDNDSANRRVVLVSGSTSGSDSKAEKKQALGLEKMD